MIWFALGGGALLLLLALAWGFANARVETLKTVLAWTAGGFAAVIAVVLLASGRGAQAFWAVALLGPLLWRWLRAAGAARTFRRGGHATPGQSSTVETATLAMTLDHDTGRMAGRVRRGVHAGRDLAELTLSELVALRAECARDDAESVPLLESWLDHGYPDWRDVITPDPAAGPMTRADALEILGLAEGATAAQIKAAHRRLMAVAHPDRGGSDWLAARLNQARDMLLG